MRPFQGASHRQKSNIDTAAGGPRNIVHFYTTPACIPPASLRKLRAESKAVSACSIYRLRGIKLSVSPDAVPGPCAEWMATMADLKTCLALLLDTPDGKALIEKGREFSAEELHGAFAQVLAETDGDVREVIKAAMNALMARRAN